MSGTQGVPESNVCAFALVEWDEARECANTRPASNHHRSGLVPRTSRRLN
jgi:hypothetical protein